MAPRSRTLALIGLIALAALAAGGAWLAGSRPGGAPAPAAQASAVGGPFRLVDQNGRPVDESILKGKWTAIFFGYTYCPDVCPTTLQSLARAQEALGPRAKDLQIVFLSVDPERDTPEQLKDYLALDSFPKGTIGLTGTPEQVAAAAKVFRVYVQKQGEGEGYLVDHSTAVYLMNPQGRFDRPLRYDAAPDEMAAIIRAAMTGS